MLFKPTGGQFRDQLLSLRFSVKERKNSQSRIQNVQLNTQITSPDDNRVKSSHRWPSRPASRTRNARWTGCATSAATSLSSRIKMFWNSHSSNGEDSMGTWTAYSRT